MARVSPRIGTVEQSVEEVAVLVESPAEVGDRVIANLAGPVAAGREHVRVVRGSHHDHGRRDSRVVAEQRRGHERAHAEADERDPR